MVKCCNNLPITPLEVAISYLRKGFKVVPIPHQSKRPILSAWQKLRLGEDELPQYFNGQPQNVGVLLGEISGDLIDVDIDCKEAEIIAPLFLPGTHAVFGRISKPRSHFLYRSQSKTERFVDPLRHKSPKDRDSATLIEIRGAGAQTILPGSTHESGEPVAWSCDGEPSSVDIRILRCSVTKVAAASLMARYWSQGIRHNASLALAGGLLGSGWTQDETVYFIEAICTAAGDDEITARVRNVASTVEKLEPRQSIQGWPTLADLVGQPIVRRLREWLGIQHASSGRDPRKKAQPFRNPVSHRSVHKPTWDFSEVDETESPFRPDGQTDLANARRFVRLHGANVRFCHPWDKWIVWDGRRWQEDDCGYVERLAKTVPDRIFSAALDHDNNSTLRFAVKSASSAGIHAMLALAKSEPGIPVLPSDFDRNPMLFNVANGTLELHSGQLKTLLARKMKGRGSSLDIPPQRATA